VTEPRSQALKELGEGELGLCREPAASGADECCAIRKLPSGLERSDKENDGLRKQAVKV